ncbi:MAG TPA: sensor domain-containing protein [Mycobacterium sp.]|nr:sensor domain-containing protein [Mycobacterium sp.]
MQPTSGCNQTVQITDLDSKPTWELSAPKLSDGDAKWHMAQLYQGDPVGWNCYFDLRAAENTILQAQICQMGNAGPAVGQMMDQIFAARVCQRGDAGADVPTILDRIGNSIPA